MCVHEGMYAWDSLDWARWVCDSMLHVRGGQAQYIVGDGVVGVNPVCTLEGAYEGRTGDAHHIT